MSTQQGSLVNPQPTCIQVREGLPDIVGSSHLVSSVDTHLPIGEGGGHPVTRHCLTSPKDSMEVRVKPREEEKCSWRSGDVPSSHSNDGNGRYTSCTSLPGGPGEVEMSRVLGTIENPVEFGRQLPGETAPTKKNPII